MLENDVVPLLAGALGHAAQHRDHAALDEQVEQHADKHQYGNAADGVHPVGKAVEPVRQTGVQLVHDIGKARRRVRYEVAGVRSGSVENSPKNTGITQVMLSAMATTIIPRPSHTWSVSR